MAPPVESVIWPVIVARKSCPSNQAQEDNSSSADATLTSFPFGTIISERLLFWTDSERFHLSVKIAALQAQQLGGAGDIAVGFFQLLQDVLALHGLAQLLQTSEA